MSLEILCIDTATGARTTPTCTNGKLDVNATVSPPEGGATEATLASIDSKTPALGQALAAASVPVVLTAAQLATLASQTTLAAVLAALSPGTNVHSTALEKSKVVSAVPCTLRKIVATNTGVADAWLLLFDLVALPANGTVPDRDPIPVPAGSPQGWESIQGTSFAVGCVAALSSTAATLTLILADEALFNAEKV